MPLTSNPIPTTINKLTIYQDGRSKSSYSGTNTSTSTPDSHNASPIISSVNFFPDKVTPVLAGLRQFLFIPRYDTPSTSSGKENRSLNQSASDLGPQTQLFRGFVRPW
jgi:hypothetical protein